MNVAHQADALYLLCRRVIAGLVPAGTVLPIIKGPLRGERWIVGATAGPNKGLSVFINQHEPEKLQSLLSIAESTHICFDIGANVGLVTLLLARRTRFVYAFEPSARNICMWHRIMSINAADNCTLLPVAVSSLEGLSRFKEARSPSEGGLSSTGQQLVPCVTCDQVVRHLGIQPDLIKIDVEGAELDVLRGAADILSRKRPLLIVEFHSPDLRRDGLQFLSRYGYTSVVEVAQRLDGPVSEVLVG